MSSNKPFRMVPQTSSVDGGVLRLPVLRLHAQSRLHGHPVMLANLRSHNGEWSVVARRCLPNGLPAFTPYGCADEDVIRLVAPADVAAYESYLDSGSAVVRLQRGRRPRARASRLAPRAAPSRRPAPRARLA